MELPIAPFKRILANNQYRVSDDAAELLAQIVEDYAKDVAERAGKLAEHANRTTIKPDDVDLACV